MKKLLLGLPIAAALLLGACGETAVEKVDKEKTPAASEKKKDEKKKDQVYKIGDTVKINDVEYTIKSAKLSNGQQYVEPSKGKVLTIDLTATNKSDSKVYISSTEFNLSKGDEQLENYFADKAHIGADLNKGKTISGVIQYDVEGPGTYELIYTPTFSLDAKEIKWKISVK